MSEKKTVKKMELVDRIKNETGIRRTEVDKVISSLINVITDGLSNDEIIIIPQLGRFENVKYKDRVGSHPVTKERIEIKGRKIPKFHASNYLIEEVNRELNK